MLNARNLIKTMDQKRIIDDVNIDIEDDQTIVIIGPSGSGKSTLLRLLTELIRADNGMIKYDDLYMCKKGENGAIYSDKKTLKKINQKFGFIFQNFALFENLSVLENVSLSLRYVKKLRNEEADKKAYEALKSLGLENEISKNVDNLSGGQKQRVSIARCLVMNPEIIFFDEPTSALDPTLTKEVLNVIKKLSDQKKTMLIVTHEMKFAKSIADKIIFMKDGKILDSGSVEYMINNDNIVIRQFLS